MEKYLKKKKKIDDNKLQEVANEIKKGKVAIFPTETVYGIGTNGLDQKAIEKLYEVKFRPFNKPITLLVSDMEMIKKVARDITDMEYKLMEAFFPGPFTIILKKKDIVPNILTANGDTVGIRMPDSEIARKIVEYAGVPVATTSANISGRESGTNIESIVKEFADRVDFYVDGGESKIGIGSTIAKVVNGRIRILRQGSISKEQIDKIINEW